MLSLIKKQESSFGIPIGRRKRGKGREAIMALASGWEGLTFGVKE